MNERNRKCTGFPRILVAKFQKRTSHKDMHWGWRQQEMGMTCPKDVTSTVRWTKHGHFSPATQPSVKLKWVRSPDVFTHPHSWEPIWTYAWKGRQGPVLFFHNSLLHSNIKSSFHLLGGRQRPLFSIKPISNDWPHCPKATWRQHEKNDELHRLHSSSEIAPPAKERDTEDFL